MDAPFCSHQPAQTPFDSPKLGLFFQLKSTPDLLRDQQEVAQPGSTEYTKELIYSILKDR